jgi:hypothetical protein
MAEQLAMGTWANVARRWYEAKLLRAWDPFRAMVEQLAQHFQRILHGTAMKL